jgi:hypothetical protein
MTLADLRKFSIRKQFRIRFPLQNGLECVINERGMAQVPALKSVPDFNLEQELAGARQFVLEPVVPAGDKHPPKARPVAREELEALAMVAPASAAAHDDHDDE